MKFSIGDYVSSSTLSIGGRVASIRVCDHDNCEKEVITFDTSNIKFYHHVDSFVISNTLIDGCSEM